MMRRRTTLPAMLRPMVAAVVVAAAVLVVGVAGDSDASGSDEDFRGSYSQYQSTAIPYRVSPPLTATSYLSHRRRPNTYNLKSSTSHGRVLRPSSKPYGRKKPKVTRIPLTFSTSANPFHGFGSHGYRTLVGNHNSGYGKRPSNSCPAYTMCVPLIVCCPLFDEIKDNEYSLTCSIYGGAKGVCCPEIKIQERLFRMFSTPRIPVRPLSFSNDVVNEAGRSALWQLEERDKLESVLRARRIAVVEPGTPEYAHLQFFRTSPRAVGISRDGLTNVGASDYLVTRFRLSPLEAGFGLQQVSLERSVIENTCPETPRCGEKERFYRTIDGSCNNLDNPSLGQANTPLMRITSPTYSDGLMRPRRSVTGGPLPSARLVSTSVVPDEDRPNTDLTLYVMQWGQFIDHDLSHTPIFRFANDSGIECCLSDGMDFVDPSLIHPSCFPIEIPADDPFHASRTGRRCMNFVRSMISPRDCSLGFAEQMNQLTHYLDGSNIYGSSEEEESLLRAFTGGLMKVQERELLPPDFEAMECESLRDGFPCFRAGDTRVNEQVELSVMHTVWVRFHNYIAREIRRLNPNWNDETIFQETRRIVVAMYQHIIYNEWLPIVLGADFMAERNMLPLRSGFSTLYDPTVSPLIANAFSTAAFRFGHTLVQGMLDLIKKGGRRGRRLDLVTQFNNPQLLYTPGKLDEFLRGLATQPPQQTDNFVTMALTNRLFESDIMPFGMDLVALNLQRSRDHAIGTYNDLREVTGLPRARSFEDFRDVLPDRVVAQLSRVYASPDDVEAFVAGIAERNAEDSILGPTFRAIIADQFLRLKVGDRFFYDLGGMPTSFTSAQLQQIRQISFARVLCETGDNIMFIQPLALRAPRGINEITSCDDPAIPQIDLTAWSSSRGTYH